MIYRLDNIIFINAMSMKRLMILLFSTLLVLTACQNNEKTAPTTIDDIRKLDFSHVIMPDTIFIEPDDYDFDKRDYTVNDNAFVLCWFEPIGFRSDNFQRFYIHYDTVYHKGNGVYYVEGRTRYLDTVRFFSGKLTLDSLRMNYEEYLPSTGEFGSLFGHYLYDEDEFSGGGTLSGKMKIGFAKINGRYYYDAFMLFADGYENNQYEGVWTSKDLSRLEKCNWGDFRIPNSNELDGGCVEFIPCEEFLDRGWQTYTYAWADDDSLWTIYLSDEQWFTHDKDYIIPYSGRLQRYLKEYARNNRPAAEYVLATIPATKDEYNTWYDMVEAPYPSPYESLYELMPDYALADSSGIMFAFMRMGEFSDGCVSEMLFDYYIYLKKRYPVPFNKYRKCLSRDWNFVFDEWEKEMGDVEQLVY